jgi:hypothetical protein
MGLLRRQQALYGRLHRLAERQRGLIATNDSGSLLTLLGDRQKLVESLMQVSQELAPHRDAWAKTRRSLSKEDQAEADHILADVSRMLGQVISADERDARLLSARKAQTAGALQELRCDQQAVSAYAASARQAGVSGRLSEQS